MAEDRPERIVRDAVVQPARSNRVERLPLAEGPCNVKNWPP